MLHVLRQHKNSKVVWATLALIIGVFSFWGVGVGLNAGDELTTVASVDGEPIGQMDLLRTENNLVQTYRNALKGQFTPELRKAFNLRQKALDALIDREVLARRAANLGLVVADQELRDSISTNPAFLAGGRFSKESYLRALRYGSLTPADYEEGLRKQLAIDRLQNAVTDGITVGDAEVRDEIVAGERTVAVRAVAVKASDHAGAVKVDETALRAWFDAHADRFQNPERMKLEMIAYPAEKFMPGPPSELDILAFFDAHQADRFHQQVEVRARHILVKAPEGADEKARAGAREKIEEIRKQVAAGANFEKLARERSEDPGSAAQGGDLGFFGKGRMVAPFEEVAFGLEPGETSGIVETPFGFHVIRVEEIRPERDKTLDEVRGEIVSELVGLEARSRAREAADADLAGWQAGKSPDDLARPRGLTVERPGAVARSASLPGIGIAFNVTNALWALGPGEIAGPIDANGTWVLARQIEKVPAGPQDFAEVKDKVESAYRLDEGGKAARALAEGILAAARTAGLEKAAAEARAKVEKPAAFGRAGGGYVPGIGSSAELKEAALALSDAHRLADRLFDVAGDWWVVELDTATEPSAEEIAKRIPETRRRMLEARREGVLGRYLEELKAKAHIEVDRQRIDAMPEI